MEYIGDVVIGHTRVDILRSDSGELVSISKSHPPEDVELVRAYAACVGRGGTVAGRMMARILDDARRASLHDGTVVRDEHVSLPTEERLTIPKDAQYEHGGHLFTFDRIAETRHGDVFPTVRYMPRLLPTAIRCGRRVLYGKEVNYD